jgi:hypothetical protein
VLVDRALASTDGDPPRAADLTTADRDRLLAAIYERTFGGRIASTVRCTRCEARFDVSFALRALVTDADANRTTVSVNGIVPLPDGRRYRLPTGADECAALDSSDAAGALLAACALDGMAADDADIVPALMRATAPLLDTDLAARCAECATDQTIRFDVQTYLLASLTAEAPQRVRDVHRNAVAYGWSRGEIMALTREQRRAHVALIDAEMPRRRRVGA